ncbi:7728_t:CDS:2, partial [Entrophospora sp. SA101]
IATIRILRDKDEKPKGFGYVEFKDLESLSKALDMTGENLSNRPIRVTREDRTAGEWRRSSPRETPSSSPRNERFNSADRYGYKEDNRWSNDRGGFRDRGNTHYGHRGGSGGDRGGDRGDRGGDRGDRGSDRGDRGSDRGDRGSDRGDRNSDRGDRGDRGGFGSVGGGDRPERKPDTEWKGGAFSGGSNSNIRSGGYRDRRSEGGHRDPHMKRNDTRSPNYNRRESSDSSIHHIQLKERLETRLILNNTLPIKECAPFEYIQKSALIQKRKRLVEICSSYCCCIAKSAVVVTTVLEAFDEYLLLNNITQLILIVLSLNEAAIDVLVLSI